jgi:hypothetical protein
MNKMTDFTELPKKIADRVKGQVYINKKNKFVKWTGKKLEYMCECGKSKPCFNYEGETKAMYCGSCKKEHMIDIKNKKCISCKKTQPTYNYPDEIRLYCSSCKKPGMINVKDKKCQCGKAIPHYNYEGETTAICCASCQKPGMVDVKHSKCKCGIRPTYNYPGETKGICCASCREDTMVDVNNKKCKCGKSEPCFNYKGETTAICCASCKEPNMVDIINKKCKCGKSKPCFNYEGETKAICCSSCKTPKMVDIINKKCISEWCYIHPSNKQYEGYCLRCFIYHFPDKPVVRNYKTKEFAVVEYIKTYFPNVDWIADKTVNGCRNGKRPDLLLDLGYQVIIIEIDEDQHNSSKYDCSCENKRIMELSQDVGHRQIVFIRFNPDKYEIRDGTKITSCWGTDGFGICVVKKDKKKEWQERLNCLKNTIDYWVIPENKTNKTIETIELFYDEEYI